MQSKNIAVLLTDTHLFERGTRKDTVVESNYEDVKEVFKQAIQLAIDNGINYVIHAGDFFDSRKHQSQNLMISAYTILELFRDSGIELILVTGNHDKTDYKNKHSFLYPFRDHPNLRLVEDDYHFDDNDNKIRFHFIAYFDNSEYLEILDNQSKFIHRDYKNVLVTHIGIGGVLTNEGDEVEESIKFSHFDDYDKVLIGHFHDFGSYHNGKVIYIGSALQHNFGENNDKGVTLLSNDLKLQRIKSNFKEFVNISLDITELTESDINDIVSDNKDEYRKITLTGDPNLIKALDKTKLIEAGIKVDVKADVLEVQKIEQRIESHSDESIIGEWGAFCEKNNYDKDEGLKYLEKVL